MPVSVNEQTVDAATLNETAASGAVNFNNIKSIGELHALTAGLAGQNLGQAQQRLNEIANNLVAQSMASAQQIADQSGRTAQRLSEAAFLAAQDNANAAAAFGRAMTARTSRFLLDISAEEAVGFAKQ